ncbi:hypothetical protein JCM8547_004747 [Rhodosporidiobolus lusitaniae]
MSHGQLGTLEAETATRFMASHLFRTCLRRQWVHEGGEDAVAIRLAKRNYILHPVDERLQDFQHALNQLNAEVAVTVSADVVKVVAASLHPDADVFSLTQDDHVQIVDTMAELAHARAAQHACFIRNEQRIVIWADRVDELEETVQQFESKLVAYVFGHTLRPGFHARSTTHSTMASSIPGTPRLPPSPSFASLIHPGVGHFDEKGGDMKEIDGLEAGIPEPPARRLPLNHAIYVGLAISIDILCCCLLVNGLLHDSLLDGQWIRMAIAAAVPFIFCIFLFMAEAVVGVIAQILLPIGQMSINTLYYSGQAPRRQITGALPHISILMPVYKESLEEVLAPTIESVSHAIRTYELQGGTASIIVCEDGMQLVDEAEVEKRKDYYDRLGVAWVARPKENRAGRFKKSSNLNVTHALALRIEELMDTRRPTNPLDLATWNQLDEDALYQWAMDEALAERGGTIWANGNLRHGELILLIDSDTRIPRDCFLDAACEMSQSPEVGVLQHQSGTFLAGAGYFENFIAFFTTTVNHSISWNVANGASAPFMGHNAYLRWSAMQHQSLANPNNADNVWTKNNVWSEEHVSEDFVMSLNMTKAGYITRWATYANCEYQEGVSLTCDDELNRWQKYAFGCSEMVFNRLIHWPTRGPVSQLFRKFIWGHTPLPTKISNCSYIASYWAIAIAPPMTLVYYFLAGEFIFELNSAFLTSFEVWIACLVTYTGCGTLAIAVSRYRSQATSLWQASVQAITYLIPSCLFFSGLSWHVMTALLAHITGYNMQWGATQKDVTNPSITEEIPTTAYRHKFDWPLAILIIAGVIVMSTSLLPLQWRIDEATTMLPILWLCCGHFLYPILLNPAIMLFRF